MPSNTDLNPPIIDPLEREPLFIEVSWETNDEKLIVALEVLFDCLTFKTRKKRPDAIQNLKKHLRAVLIAFIRNYQHDPDIPTACPRNNSFGTDSYPRNFDPINPNLLNFKKIREVLDGLVDSNFLEMHKGRQGWFNGEYLSRMTRYNMTTEFISFIEDHNLDQIKFEKKIPNDGFLIKANKGVKNTKRSLKDYSDIINDFEILESKHNLRQYNEFINQSVINLEHQVIPQTINLANKHTHRVFNDKDYTLGGRFYGGWWTNCKRENRRYISINGKPTVECDYTANHLYLFYGMRNAEMTESLRQDPYVLTDRYPRGIIKIFIARLFNCEGTKGILKHLSHIIRWEQYDDSEEKDLIERYCATAEDIERVLDCIFTHHPILRSATNKLDGLKLHRLDSLIAEYVLRNMTESEIPTLCIHDSFIVPSDNKQQLINAMKSAYYYFGIPKARPPIKEKFSKLVLGDNDLLSIQE